MPGVAIQARSGRVGTRCDIRLKVFAINGQVGTGADSRDANPLAIGR